jgi:hypothetical protein
LNDALALVPDTTKIEPNLTLSLISKKHPQNAKDNYLLPAKEGKDKGEEVAK